jgi:programmed cell death 6-interacting protein
LVEPLQAFITAQYKSDDKNPFSEEGTEAVNEFNKLRYKAVIQPLDKHDSSLEVLYRYYDQLAAVDAKLPLTPTQIPINFKWKDAFDKGSLFFGKAALSEWRFVFCATHITQA